MSQTRKKLEIWISCSGCSHRTRVCWRAERLRGRMSLFTSATMTRSSYQPDEPIIWSVRRALHFLWWLRLLSYQEQVFFLHTNQSLEIQTMEKTRLLCLLLLLTLKSKLPWEGPLSTINNAWWPWNVSQCHSPQRRKTKLHTFLIHKHTTLQQLLGWDDDWTCL